MSMSHRDCELAVKGLLAEAKVILGAISHHEYLMTEKKYAARRVYGDKLFSYAYHEAKTDGRWAHDLAEWDRVIRDEEAILDQKIADLQELIRQIEAGEVNYYSPTPENKVIQLKAEIAFISENRAQ